MPYLQSYRGDYLASHRGDPGLFGNIFRGFKGAVSGFLSGGPIAAARGGLRGFTGQKRPGAITIPYRPQFAQPSPVIRSIQRGIPGGKTGYELAPGMVMPKRRRMNVGNAKALRRAIRRTDGFVKLARKALKGTKYTITTRGSTRKPMRIVEHGPGSVTVQR